MTFSKQYSDGHLGCFPPGIKAEAMNPIGYVSAMLEVPVERFLSMVEIAYPEIPNDVLRDGIGLRVMPQDAKRIRGSVRAACAYFGGNRPLTENVARNLQNNLEVAFLTGLSNACRPGARCCSAAPLRRGAILRRVIDTIWEAPQATDILGLCRQVGQSRRTIETVFREALHTSPAHYIRVAKLHAARSALLAGPRQSGLIKKAALEAGFWHLGHFSQAYRDLFGELPRDTLLQQGL